MSLGVMMDILLSPLNWTLLLICVFLLYIAFRPKKAKFVRLEDLPKQDFTLSELAEYDGISNNGRILIAVKGFVFDVTNNGQDTYGKNGPYSHFAGHDASRALAKFSATEDISHGYDDLSDLTTDQMNNLKEWERQFREKFVMVGRLLAPNETHQVYDPDESVDEVFGTPLSGQSKKKQ